MLKTYKELKKERDGKYSDARSQVKKALMEIFPSDKFNVAGPSGNGYIEIKSNVFSNFPEKKHIPIKFLGDYLEYATKYDCNNIQINYLRQVEAIAFDIFIKNETEIWNNSRKQAAFSIWFMSK
jgi:hypothetical protein